MLEREFKAELESLVGERSLSRFQSSFERLYRALKTCYVSEQRLVKRCQELNDTIVNNTTRVKAALRLTQEDSAAINMLKKEVDRAWKLVETAKDKENKLRTQVSQLQTELVSM